MPLPALVIVGVAILGFFFFIGPIGSLLNFDFLASGLAGWERAFAAIIGSLAFYYGIQYFAPENLASKQMRLSPLMILLVIGVGAYYFAVKGSFSVFGIGGSPSSAMIEPIDFIIGAVLAYVVAFLFANRKRIGFK